MTHKNNKEKRHQATKSNSVKIKYPFAKMVLIFFCGITLRFLNLQQKLFFLHLDCLTGGNFALLQKTEEDVRRNIGPKLKYKPQCYIVATV